MHNPYTPPVGFCFDVRVLDMLEAISIVAGKTKINESIDGSFQEVSGISVEIETEELKEGGENRFTHTLPGRPKYSNLLLKRGMVTVPSGLGIWVKQVIEGGLAYQVPLKNMLVTLLNEDHIPVMTWLFVGAMPIKWDVSGMNAQSNELVIESMEFKYQRFETVHLGVLGKVAKKVKRK